MDDDLIFEEESKVLDKIMSREKKSEQSFKVNIDKDNSNTETPRKKKKKKYNIPKDEWDGWFIPSYGDSFTYNPNDVQSTNNTGSVYRF